MENDKQIYLIFQAEPQWLYLLAGWHSPGPSRFESVTFKALESRSDGILVCDAVDGPMTVVEVQGYYDQNIYARAAIEMALLQKQNPHREIRGITLFLDPTFDPRTEPWTRIIQSISLSEPCLLKMMKIWNRRLAHVMLESRTVICHNLARKSC